ncbi:MAG: metallophosphoesterase [Clostridia bacterium]|nr:metallophosphoesterase [Clostridia bacterium]
MKKYSFIRVVAVLLMSVIGFNALVACGNKNPNDTFFTGDSSATNDVGTTGAVTEDNGTQNENDNPNSGGSSTGVVIRVLNGTVGEGYNEYNCLTGESVTLKAKETPVYQRFSHWKNSKGENLGTTATLDVTVQENETYIAVFETKFSTPEDQLYKFTQDMWQQGGANGTFTEFKVGDEADTTRVCLKEPYFLEKGATIDVILPKDGAVGYIFCTPKENSNTGDFFKDYKIGDTMWRLGQTISSFTLTAEEDTYIMFVARHKEGTLSFSVSDVADMTFTVTPAEDAHALGRYWDAEVEDTIDKIEANRNTIGSGISEFFYLTDTHWTANSGCSPALINYLAEQLDIPYVVFGGDIIEQYNPIKQSAIDDEILSFYNAFNAELNIFSTLGNHDRNFSSGCTDWSLRISQQEAYDLYQKRSESFAVMTEGDPDHGYYDDTVNKVRYVQFYLSDSRWGMPEDSYVDAALNWAEEKIMELDEDWTVVLFTHAYWYGSAGGYTEKNKAISERVLSIKANADADLAIWITGHIHSDKEEILTSSDGKTSLRLISLNADSYIRSNTANSFKMTLGTVTESSFTCFQIDVANKKIYITRVGAGGDLVYSY